MIHGQNTLHCVYLTKKVRKNNGEKKQYLVENSHDPIIDPHSFDQVQALLESRYEKRNYSGSLHPFANRLVCAECGHYYGHKVWHNRHNTERYDVWYCNRRYNDSKTCGSPILREKEIKTAFELILKRRKAPDPTYSDERWRTLVECVTVYPDRKLRFKLKEGSDECVRI